MRRCNIGERVRGYLAAHDVPQSAVASVCGTDPGAVSRELNALEPDAWRLFTYGVAVGQIVNRRNGRQDRQPA